MDLSLLITLATIVFSMLKIPSGLQIFLRKWPKVFALFHYDSRYLSPGSLSCHSHVVAAADIVTFF